MFPVLLTIGKIPISSYGVFLSLGFLVGIFLIWRLSRAWDLDEEKILDISLLTFLGGFIGARLYFVLEHWQFFSQNLLSVVFLNKLPGFSFWGAFLGGWLALFYFTKRFKVDFWQFGDIASIGLLCGLIFSEIGCFLGGCDIGKPSGLFFAIPMVGSLGKRFPTQIIEAILLFLVFLKLWSATTHFHLRGKIMAWSLIYIGLVKLLTTTLKQSHESIFLAAVLVILGINIFYKVTKKSLLADLKSLIFFVGRFFKDSMERKDTIARVKKYWYNQKTQVAWSLRGFKKNLSLTKILRRFNVRLFYKNNKLY